MTDRYDVVIVGGGSAGCALANRLSADRGTSVLVLEAGRSDFRIDPFIHMPAALPFPIGNRLYDWKYETDPEPHLNGRRVYHARGKVLGGSSSINGMIFQRGNPLDYERWAADPGMKEWDYAHCLPYFKRMETCRSTAPSAPTSGAAATGPLVLERGPGRQPAVRRVLRGGAAGRLPAHRRRQRLPPGGLREVRPQPAPRPPALGRPRLPAPGPAPQEPARARRWRWPPRCGSTASGRSASTTSAPDGARTVDAGEVILCGGAINTPQLLQLSGVGDRQHLTSLGVDVVHHLPGVGENLQDHLEVYIQYASKQPVSIAPGLRWRQRARASATSGCSTAAASAPPTTSRAAASPAATTTSTTPT